MVVLWKFAWERIDLMVYKLIAKQDTILKTKPVQSTNLADHYKFLFLAGKEQVINWYTLENGHYKVELRFTVKGYYNWYAYIPHVTLEAPTPITHEQVNRIIGTQLYPEEYEDLLHCLRAFEINSPARLCHFISQCAHESGGMRWLKELSDGWYLENRGDLGNVNPGDGPKYKGAGAIQLTGRFNYTRLAEYMKDNQIVQLGCDYVATHYPFSSAGFWWKDNDMNTLCDAGASCRDISARVNGRDPANGLAERERYYARALEVIPG